MSDSDNSSVSTIEKMLGRFGRSTSLGVAADGAAADRRSLFAAAGFDWPDHPQPESVHARQTDYPFSVDVGGGQIVAALDRAGQVRRAVRATGSRDVRGESIPGVYTHKELEYWSGTIGWAGLVDGRPVETAPTSCGFIGNVLPMFTRRVADVEWRWVVAAASGAQADPIVCFLLEASNLGATAVDITVATTLNLTAGELTAVAIDWGSADGAPIADGVRLEPGDRIEASMWITFGQVDVAPFDGAAAVSLIEDELEQRASQFGKLTIAGEQWYSGQLTRLTELARQSSLYAPDGLSVGSFWGSNGNPIPDVWFRDLAYTTLALVEFAPTAAADQVRYLCRYAIPERPWEREAELLPDATGVEHSLGNACLPAVIAGALVRTHGADALSAAAAEVAPYLLQLVGNLVASYKGAGTLFRTLYISDGPSRGLFHTGSNILAWAALRAVANDLRELTPGLDHAGLARMADELRDTIDRRCVADLGEAGLAYVEGIYGDGRAVAVHDGEESDLTLASYYGYAPRDDKRVIAHARWARSTENPYFTEVGNGVDFWDWDEYNGVTYPAHAHALAEADDPASLLQALEVVRRTTDADGSLWWWPFAHGESDSSRVKRGLSKCGWSAGVLVARLMHDVLGIRRSWQNRALTIAPSTPWAGYAWNDLPLGTGHIDVDHTVDERGGLVRVRNRTDATLSTKAELPVPRGHMIEDIQVDGENGRYESEVVRSYGGSAVRIEREVEPGASFELTVTWSKVQAR